MASLFSSEDLQQDQTAVQAQLAVIWLITLQAEPPFATRCKSGNNSDCSKTIKKSVALTRQVALPATALCTTGPHSSRSLSTQPFSTVLAEPFADYLPRKVKIGIGHPDPVGALCNQPPPDRPDGSCAVKTTSMAAVAPPDPSYK